MKRIGLAALVAGAFAGSVFAQTVPPFSPGTLPTNNQFWAQNGASVARLGDRVFGGGATANDAAYPNVALDWLSTLQTGWGLGTSYVAGAQAAFLTNSVGRTGLLGGAQTNGTTPGIAIGNSGFAASNDSGGNSAWAFYGEAYQVSGNGAASGMELDPVAFQNNAINPTPNQQGQIRGIQLGCGGSYNTFDTIYPCSVALQIVSNNQTFDTGINVLRGSIAGTNPAIQLPTGNGIAFVDAAGHYNGSIKANFSAGTNPTALNFTDSGFQISGAGATAIAYFTSVGSSAVNWLTFSSALTANSPTIGVSGSDSNVSLNLTARGSGLVVVPALQAASGSHPTLSGTCSTATGAGGDSAGTITFSSACASGTVIVTFHETSPTGWHCRADDMTTPAATLKQTAYGTNWATLTVTGAANSDIAVFSCLAF